ncbi:hypothetical protein EXIGLDRAFT_835856 [Exidia glandulosa HHB12029]|uniref:Uncharacterized protein n=1 Tax=Exidia glandulosa HHB12029 TaxID=1314781 RepID=A0A165ICL9_EXIGL|nr:hypothetical protein EXIGLDRAFT_835856 [Exidia glandulosa HHB12029]
MATTTATSWPAEGETPLTLYIEHNNFFSIVLGSIFYGIHFSLFLATLRYLWRRNWRNVSWGLVLYVIALFVLATLYLAGSVHWRMRMFVDDRAYPGGPAAFYIEQFSQTETILSNSAYIIINFLSDGLLLWRCWVIYNRNYRVVILPSLVFAASTILSILVTYTIAQPGTVFATTTAMRITLPYFALSMSLNMLLTLMIATRLLTARSQFNSHHAQLFTSIISMLVESAALYAIFSIAFIITYTMKDALFNVVLHIQAQIMCISPLLILIRVARGRAYAAKNSTGVVLSGNRLSGVPPGQSGAWKNGNDTMIVSANNPMRAGTSTGSGHDSREEKSTELMDV